MCIANKLTQEVLLRRGFRTLRATSHSCCHYHGNGHDGRTGTDLFETTAF